MDRLDVRVPSAELVFSVIENLACRVDILEWCVHIARDDGGVVEQVHETAGLLRE
jgi:hypothetical protein